MKTLALKLVLFTLHLTSAKWDFFGCPYKPPLKNPFDMDKYEGVWYEIARDKY